MRRIIVVGGSLAGLSTARALRSAGYDGDLVVVGDEAVGPYARPLLSKEFLATRMEPAELALEPDGEELGGIRWMLGARAVGLEPGRLFLDDGASLPYDGLVIATGARAREDLPGAHLDGVHGLRTLDDAVAIRADLQRRGRVLVVGGGFLASEIASTAQAMGCHVTLLVPGNAPLRARLGPYADAIATLHRRNGVQLMTDARVTAIRKSGDELIVTLADGWQCQADTVVLGLGAVPEIAWLEGSGLELGDGVLCDANGAASLPNVVAVGDCAAWFDPTLGRQVRGEHWSSAVDQGSIAARTLLGLEPLRRAPLPHFWSELHGTCIQVAGHVELADSHEVLAGSVAAGSFAAVYRRRGQPVAVLALKQPKEFTSILRRLAPIPAHSSLQGASA